MSHWQVDRFHLPQFLQLFLPFRKLGFGWQRHADFDDAVFLLGCWADGFHVVEAGVGYDGFLRLLDGGRVGFARFGGGWAHFDRYRMNINSLNQQNHSFKLY